MTVHNLQRRRAIEAKNKGKEGVEAYCTHKALRMLMTMVQNQKPFTYSVVPPGKPSNCRDSVRGAQGLESKTEGEMKTPTNRNSRR